MTDPQTVQVKVGVVAESGTDERRVALVPKAVASLTGTGVAVVVESGAGERALLPDQLYTDAGASIGDAWAADVVVKVAPPTADEVAKLRDGQTLIGFLAPRNADNSIDALKAAGVQAFALEAIPRISRAQAMDVLSSQANIAGYKAVLVAADLYPRYFPMFMTAAGPAGNTGQTHRGLRELFSYPLMSAIVDRRTRRVARGTSIPSGPISYTSTNKPEPLTPLEEAILIVSTGLTGSSTGS